MAPGLSSHCNWKHCNQHRFQNKDLNHNVDASTSIGEVTSFTSNLDSGPGAGGVKGKYDIRVTVSMKVNYSQFIEEKNVLHRTILCQTEKKKKTTSLHAVHLPRQRISNMSIYMGLSCKCGNISASRTYVFMKWRPIVMHFFH